MERRPRRHSAKYAPKYHSAPAATMAHCLRTLAGYLTPPQTYELCQTAKAFQVNENGVPRATRALRVSLERSLARVLKARGVSPEAVDFKALVDADGRPGALISGSTMVQCVLGTVWTGDEHRGARRSYQTEPSSEYYRVYEQTLANGRTLTLYYKDKIDVDIFTTAAAAPGVRSRLCGRGLTLSTVQCARDCMYHDLGAELMGKALESRVHHMEGYARTPPSGYVFDEYDSENEDFSLAQATAWASGATRDMKIRNDSMGGCESEGAYVIIEDWNAPEYRIRAAADTDAFTYDRRLDEEKIIDLVVAESSAADARDLLAQFDLDICKASFDGRVFRIPDPHRSFRSETRIDPRRLELMSAFADKLLEKPPSTADGSPPNIYESEETWDAICHVFDTTREGQPKWQEGFVSTDEYLMPKMHHNWFAKLFLRQEKYKSRGIRLLDVPPNFATVEQRIKIEGGK